MQHVHERDFFLDSGVHDMMCEITKKVTVQIMLRKLN